MFDLPDNDANTVILADIDDTVENKSFLVLFGRNTIIQCVVIGNSRFDRLR